MLAHNIYFLQIFSSWACVRHLFCYRTKKLLRASVMLVEPQYYVNLHYISFKKKLIFLPHLRSTKRVVLAPTVLNALLCFVKFEWHSFSQHWSWSWPGRVLASRISLSHAQLSYTFTRDIYPAKDNFGIWKANNSKMILFQVLTQAYALIPSQCGGYFTRYLHFKCFTWKIIYFMMNM